MTTPSPASDAGHRCPAAIIRPAVRRYFGFRRRRRRVEERRAARGLILSHQAVRQWADTFGQDVANRVRRRLPGAGDNGPRAAVARNIACQKPAQKPGQQPWGWRAVEQDGIGRDIRVPAPAQQTGRPTAPAHAAAGPRAARPAPRQTGPPGGRTEADHARHRAPAAQRPAQPSGECASADTARRAAEDAIHVGAAGTAFPLCPGPHQQPPSAPLRSPPCHLPADQGPAAPTQAFQTWADVTGGAALA